MRRRQNFIRSSIIFIYIFSPFFVLAQNKAVLVGTVKDKMTQLPIANASVLLNDSLSSVTDEEGNFTFNDLKPSEYKISVSSVSYLPYDRFNILINSGNVIDLTIELESMPIELSSVVIRGSKQMAKVASIETPLSVQRLTVDEIKTNPGGNFDISRVINTLPGVGSSVGLGSFRNDIIIRGGSPGENVFYLDGIEIPQINHFATQGSGGGPAGILNVSFIKDVKVSTSSFDAKYDNATSSVFQFEQIDGNRERFQGNLRLGSSEFAATFDGPLTNNGNHTFIGSVRASYLQYLFQLLDLPIRPNYYDIQGKTTHKLNKKTTLNFLIVSALDVFEYAKPEEVTPESLYVLSSNSLINQWNYTIGASLKRSVNNGFIEMSLSRNVLQNNLDKYEDNLNPSDDTRTQEIVSEEIENKYRLKVHKSINGFQYSYGFVTQYVKYTNDFFSQITTTESINENAILDFFRYGFYVQAGKRFFNNKLGVNIGVRNDMNTFTTNGNNLMATLSPRGSLTYSINQYLNVNASAGIYYRIQPYTILGYKEQDIYVNKDVDYLKAEHYVFGFEFLPKNTLRFTIEGFLKNYSNVPVSVSRGIALSNEGADFGRIGDENIVTNGKGRSYGIEFFLQQKLVKRIFGVLSYTFYISEYTNNKDEYIRSAWDNRHLLSLQLGYKFGKGWEFGMKFRYQGGTPYTPYDTANSVKNYFVVGRGIFDYSNLNTLTLNAFHAMDIRITKQFNFSKWSMSLFLDIQNFYKASNPTLPQFTLKRNEDNTTFVTDGAGNYIPILLEEDNANVLPSFGFIIEF